MAELLFTGRVLVPGDPGPGVPAGGTTGQVAVKASDADYDLEWVDAPEGTGGGGAVGSVNGQTGVVVLDAADVGADATGTAAAAVAAHVALSDPHTQYHTNARGDARYEPLGAVAALVGTAPSTLNTLGEISDALNDDANLAATLTAAIAGKASTSHTHDDRYYTETETDAALASKLDTPSLPAAASLVVINPDGTTDKTLNPVEQLAVIFIDDYDDGVRTDAEMIQAAIDAAAETTATRRVVKGSARIYDVSAEPFHDNGVGGANAQIVLPSINPFTGELVSIEIEGPFHPSFVYSVITDNEQCVPSQKGMIIQSTRVGRGVSCCPWFKRS